MWTSSLAVLEASVVLLLLANTSHAAVDGPNCAKLPNCRKKLMAAVAQARSSPAVALHMFETLYATYPDQRLLYNVGRMQHQLSKPQQAAESYRGYLESGVEMNQKRRQRTQDYLQQVQQEAAKLPLAVPSAVTTVPAVSGLLSTLVENLPPINLDQVEITPPKSSPTYLQPLVSYAPERKPYISSNQILIKEEIQIKQSKKTEPRISDGTLLILSKDTEKDKDFSKNFTAKATEPQKRSFLRSWWLWSSIGICISAIGLGLSAGLIPKNYDKVEWKP